MNRILLFFVVLLFSFSGYAQAPPTSSFGGFHNMTPDFKDDMPPEERELMYNRIRKNIVELSKKGITAAGVLNAKPNATVKFNWPLRKAVGFNDPSYYGISNFVDIDPSTGIKDFNCGNRTYAGHKGTDIFTVPFWWKKMDENSVEIVAAADGILVDKGGSLDDWSCANCPAVNPPLGCYDWNAVYLQHADGTLSIYGHMKKNSLTTKVYGDPISKGEFLGIVGSSGNSSGPHLHFEVWSDTFFTKLLKPWEGPCNPDGNATMWDSQQQYYNPQIIKVMSGTALPETKPCYGGKAEETYEKSSFVLGQEVVYVTTYFRDNKPDNPPYQFWLFKPDGTVQYNWTRNPFNAYYSWAYFYYTFQPGEVNIPGTWKYRVVYDKDTVDVNFQIVNVAPLDLVSFNARKDKEHILLQWQTENEQNTDRIEIEKGSDASHFEIIGNIPTKGNEQSGKNDYQFKDVSPQPGVQYYRLKMIDKDSRYKYSTTVKVLYDGLIQVKMFPNPADNFVMLQNVREYNSVSITNMSGRKLLSKTIDNNECKLDISTLPKGVYVVELSKGNEKMRLKLIKNK